MLLRLRFCQCINATRMHSSRMRTACLLTVSHSIRWGGLPNPPWMQTPLPPRCRPSTLPTGCRPPQSPRMDAHHPLDTDRQMLVKILPCPKLRLRAVMNRNSPLCILNGSVRGRVSSSRKRFWTLPNLYSEVSALSNSQGYSSSEPV